MARWRGGITYCDAAVVAPAELASRTGSIIWLFTCHFILCASRCMRVQICSSTPHAIEISDSCNGLMPVYSLAMSCVYRVYTIK